MTADTDTKAPGKTGGRSKVTNGSKVGTEMDGRTIWVRRLRDLIEAHEQDLGGSDNINQAQRSLVRRAATLSVELERLEAGFATKGQITPEDLDSYQRASNTLRRHLEVLGLRPPTGGPRVQDITAMNILRSDGRRIADVRDSIETLGVVVGKEKAKYQVARRIAYAVAQAKETGQRLHPKLAELAVELRLADFADGEEPPLAEDSAADTVDAETMTSILSGVC
ncbi:hypothetical protein [Mesorhizobium sp. M0088]|uniref:hypothetical protein n=1 Tax=Mesorhizobium sp. M0088 TaxID=2956873 RepID=UPI00333D6B8D